MTAPAVITSGTTTPPADELPYGLLFEALITMSLLGPTHNIARAALALQVALLEHYGPPPHLGEMQ